MIGFFQESVPHESRQLAAIVHGGLTVDLGPHAVLQVLGRHVGGVVVENVAGRGEDTLR